MEMEKEKEKDVFHKYHSRLAREGWLKAFLCGLGTGLAVLFVAALVTWLFGFEKFWFLAIIVGAVVMAAATFIFYYKKFRPTTAQIARRIDSSLGLEERMITMLSLQNDESYLAMRQREDAEARLGGTDRKKIRIRVAAASIAIVCVFGILGIAMSAVTVLSAQGILPNGPELFNSPSSPSVSPQEQYFTVKYTAEEGGEIDGKIKQTILFGSETESVVAVAKDGWMFSGWSDGWDDPSRTDSGVSEDMEIYAEFVKLDDETDDEDPNDKPDDLPLGDESEGSSDGPFDPNQSSGNGGKYESNNQIIDGETYYRDVFQEYYERAMERLASGEELSDELRAFIEMYFNIIL